MSMRRHLALGALVTAALLGSEVPSGADPALRDGEFRWFQLTEKPSDVARVAGAPALAAEFGSDFVSWQYHIGNEDHHDSSHAFVFRKSAGTLISVTRTFEEPRNVDTFFPSAETSTHAVTHPGQAAYHVRVRRLSGGRLLLAMGASKPGDPVTQLVLIRQSELVHFHAWLAGRL